MIKALTFIAPFGEGHRSATDALAEHFREIHAGEVEVKVVDDCATFTLFCPAPRRPCIDG